MLENTVESAAIPDGYLRPGQAKYLSENIPSTNMRAELVNEWYRLIGAHISELVHIFFD